MQVYRRLNKLGVCISHPTVSRLVKLCGRHHDKKARLWQKRWTQSLQTHQHVPSTHLSNSQTDASSPACSYVIVGDNIDKNISPRDMRVDNQVNSLHCFNSYAVLDRVNLASLASTDTAGMDSTINLPSSAILPTTEDCSTLRDNYIISVARVICDSIPYFKFMQQCVPTVCHKHASALSKKSETVSYNSYMYIMQICTCIGVFRSHSKE